MWGLVSTVMAEHLVGRLPTLEYSPTHTPTWPDHSTDWVRATSLSKRWLVHCAIRHTRTTYGDRCFAVAGPRVWNSLPTKLRQSDSLGQFKRRLKTHLFGLWDHSAL